MNKMIEPFNSRLTKAYCDVDHRLPVLALYLKDWNKRNMKSECYIHLNSYSVVLMLIAYLQHVKVLLCLQAGGESEKVDYARYQCRSRQFMSGEWFSTDVKFVKNS